MKFISKLAITSAVIALAFVSTANAQSMRVSVPFGFRAGVQSLPAGTYKVELSRMHNRITMTQLEGTAGCFLPIKANGGPGMPEGGALIFNHYGNSYFLTRVNSAGVAGAAELFTSRAEREVAKTQPGTSTVVLSPSGM
jgi:hypothetical protein